MKYNALEVKKLKKKFPEFSLSDITFTLPKGFIMGLVGENGAGKTTIIKLILDLIQKDSGTVSFFGKETTNNIDCKQDIAVVFDELFFVEDWLIKDVEAAISSFYMNWNTQIYHAYLDQFGLSKTKKVKDLSKGMKMKLMLAVALSHKAKLLILDEPTSGLDPVARDELLDFLLEYLKDETNSIIFSTHITTDLDRIADYLTIVSNGRVFYSGEKEELFERYCLVKGSLNSLSHELESKLIGIQEKGMGFTALLDIGDMSKLSKDLITEKASIDDVLIHINLKNKGVTYDNYKKFD